jgi:hypothetical protein
MFTTHIPAAMHQRSNVAMAVTYETSAMCRRRVLLTWLMLIFLVGGHWGMLQVMAWTGMVISYSRDASFAEALSMTFDGEHPCAFCHEIRDGLASDIGVDTDAERKAPSQTPIKIMKSIKADGLTNVVELTLPVAAVVAVMSAAAPAKEMAVSVDPQRRPPRNVG